MGPPQGPSGPPSGLSPTPQYGQPPGPPPGPPGPPGSPVTSGGGGNPRRTLLIAVGAVLVLIVAVAAFLVLGGDEASAGEVFTEPIDSLGNEPFVDAPPPPLSDEQVAAIAELPDQPADETDDVETFEGGTPGLYGGTRDDGRCDAEALVAFLEANPAEARAWAGVVGIEVGGISDYVGTLTPSLLRSDTRVTNHGFRDGEATSLQSVLQAGTAVFVDATGAPVVKCSCGNPLTRPSARTSPTYTGPTWDGFDPDRVIVIAPAVVNVDVYVMIDIDTGDRFTRPVGSTGDDDRDAPGSSGGPPTTEPTTTTSEPATTTTAAPTGVPTEATYAGSAGGTCGTDSITATVSGATVTIEFTGEGGSVPVSGTAAPDGSFTLTGALTGTGHFDEEAITFDAGNAECTGSFTAPRTG